MLIENAFRKLPSVRNSWHLRLFSCTDLLRLCPHIYYGWKIINMNLMNFKGVWNSFQSQAWSCFLGKEIFVTVECFSESYWCGHFLLVFSSFFFPNCHKMHALYVTFLLADNKEHHLFTGIIYSFKILNFRGIIVFLYSPLGLRCSS